MSFDHIDQIYVFGPRAGEGLKDARLISTSNSERFILFY
jgi:hypothetical protein